MSTIITQDQELNEQHNPQQQQEQEQERGQGQEQLAHPRPERWPLSASGNGTISTLDPNLSKTLPPAPTFQFSHQPSILEDDSLRTTIHGHDVHPGTRSGSLSNHPELHLQTNMIPSSKEVKGTTSQSNSIPIPRSSRPSAAALSRSSSIQSLSPNSAAGSPSMGNFLSDITPLPSPLVGGESPGPWRALIRTGSLNSRPVSRGSVKDSTSTSSLGMTIEDPSLLGNTSPSQTRRKPYNGLIFAKDPSDVHLSPPNARTIENSKTGSRSVSEQLSTKLHVPSQDRQQNTQESQVGHADSSSKAPQIKREEHLAGKHGFPPSSRSVPLSHQAKRIDDSVHDAHGAETIQDENTEPKADEYVANTFPGNKRKRWKGLKPLGQGTFSTVVLATSKDNEVLNTSNLHTDNFVAVKIIENTAAGGASQSRIESSLKRELDILKSIRHASLVHLKAFSIEKTRALLVLTYCPGGDLFDFATDHMNLLKPRLVRRMFAELVGALRYLHKQGIVHRDVKLENVLLNLTAKEIQDVENPLLYRRSITTLTDLGLSRRIDLENPLLTTRCGSEDYAAPEILLAQPYDGRQTDTWALGVLLYALMESRLPFDPIPGTAEHKMRSRTAHKIAKCDWKWFELADQPQTLVVDGVLGIEGEETRPRYDPDWNDAKAIVDGLLKRVKKRTSLDEVAKTEWVASAIVDELEEPYVLGDEDGDKD